MFNKFIQYHVDKFLELCILETDLKCEFLEGAQEEHLMTSPLLFNLNEITGCSILILYIHDVIL